MKKYCFLFVFYISSLVFAGDPSAVYLTWLHDPTSTMTIQWHTGPDDPSSKIYFKKIGETKWQEMKGSYEPVFQYPLFVHTTELTALSPDTDYLFRIGPEPKEYKFRTLPSSLTRDVLFAVGGDAYLKMDTFKKMNVQVASTSPEFIIIGGDIAYTVSNVGFLRGKNWKIKRWQTFFSEWTKAMVTKEGRLIPLLVTLGNHDIKISANPKLEDKSFYKFFALPEKEVPFRSLVFGKYLNLVLLDSGHHYKIPGPQTQWLDHALQQEAAYKLAVYHVAAYPSNYNYATKTPTQLRKNWSPLFEKYGVQAVFENHNHAFKRTHKIKNDKIDDDGVLYLGDGSWGVGPRDTVKAWYLAKAEKTNAFWLVSLSDKEATLTAINLRGKTIDELQIFPITKPPEATLTLSHFEK